MFTVQVCFGFWDCLRSFRVVKGLVGILRVVNDGAGFGWLRFRFVFRSGLFRCLGLFQVVYDGLGLFRIQVCFGLWVFFTDGFGRSFGVFFFLKKKFFGVWVCLGFRVVEPCSRCCGCFGLFVMFWGCLGFRVGLGKG